MGSISAYADTMRRSINQYDKKKLGQYFSSDSLSRLLASMMDYKNKKIDILDPGAGIGSLSIACIEEILYKNIKPEHITITAYEIDDSLIPHLNKSLELCKSACNEKNIKFSYNIIQKNFIIDTIISNYNKQFTHIIMNPPYSKINALSKIAKFLKEANIEYVNMYTTFIELAYKILKLNGQLVFISPRSFCNGVYFKSFRKNFLESISIKRIHVFNSRTTSFHDDDVLQENIIMYVRKKNNNKIILVTTSSGPNDDIMTSRNIHYNFVVMPKDPECFIHIIPDESSETILKMMKRLKNTLEDLNISVSTGKIVDYRIQKALRHNEGKNIVPLIQPFNIFKGYMIHPINSKKHNYIKVMDESMKLLSKNDNYIVVKRFSTKEAKKRISVAVWQKNNSSYPLIGFDNRVNYYHMGEKGIDIHIAKGIAMFLNSSIVDQYLRQFNGHTQINSADLKYLNYPTYEQLKVLGKQYSKIINNQNQIDLIIGQVLFGISKMDKAVMKKQKINESINILNQLGFSQQQKNIRSALTLLALLDLNPTDTWNMSKNPLLGITPMMKFFKKKYGKEYAPNSRESVRRQTIHQFLDAGIIEINPDKPDRPINSGKTVYRIKDKTLKLLKTYNTAIWDKELFKYKQILPKLKQSNIIKNKNNTLTLELLSGSLALSPGGQNILVKEIYEKFKPMFAPKGKPIYIGDAANKKAFVDKKILKKLNITIDTHGKTPDIIIQHAKGWLILIEAVTSHGPINDQRRRELQKLFDKAKSPGLVYVTAFLDKKTMSKYLSEISWESEVWVADSPDHLIHFDGKRFLGPYEK